MDDGELIDYGTFTDNNETPWWNDTEYVTIRHGDIYICYGEISAISGIADRSISRYSPIKKGQIVGHVIPVIKKPKPGQKSTMLHVEASSRIYRGLSSYSLPARTLEHYYYRNFIEFKRYIGWYNILDPTPYLQKQYDSI